MNLNLIQHRIGKDGAFGEMFDGNDIHVCFTLEHAYENEDGSLTTKLKNGVYTCAYGWSEKFKMWVYRILNVPNCTDIEIHPGNFNKDSSGCVLVGSAIIPQTGNGDLMLERSKAAFDQFMLMQNGAKTFRLTVSGKES